MSIEANVAGSKKTISEIYANVDGSVKEITSVWANKDGVPTPLYQSKLKRFVVSSLGMDGYSNLWYSDDHCKSWTMLNSVLTDYSGDPYDLHSIKYLNDRFIAISNEGYGHVYASFDGINDWTLVDLDWCHIDLHTVYDLAYGNDRLIYVGANKKYDSSASKYTYTPLVCCYGDKMMSGLPTDKFMSKIAYGKDRFVVLGSTGLSYYCMDDSNKWVKGGIGLSEDFTADALIYGGDRFICSGHNDRYSAITYYSLDGISWTEMSGSKNAWSSWDYVVAIAYGNGRFVAVAEDSIALYSLDGETWHESELDLSFTSVRDVIFANNRFVVTERWGYINHSFDGINWTRVCGDLGNINITGIAYAEWDI